MARWDASRFSGVSLYAVIASPAGRGNPVGDVTRETGAIRGLPNATAELPRRVAPRNDRKGAGEQRIVERVCTYCHWLTVLTAPAWVAGQLPTQVMVTLPWVLFAPAVLLWLVPAL